MTRLLFLMITAGLLAACAQPGPPRDAFSSAEASIAAAERAGGDEHAPVEMRFAREKLAAARSATESRDNTQAWHSVEQAEINAELAIEKSRTAEMREQVSRQRKSNDELQAQMEQLYGEAFE